MTTFVHTDFPVQHPGVVRAEHAVESFKQATQSFDGARGVASLLLAALVSALVVVANQVIDTWTEGHLLAAWSGQRLETLERCIARLLEQEAGAGVDGSTGLDGPDTASAANIDPLADMEQRIEALFAELNGDALRFQQLYYAERRYLEDLDKRRRTGYEEVLAQPAI
jgi:hypothetical protein